MTKAPQHVAGRIIQSIFFLIFLGAGIFFESLVVASLLRQYAPYLWKATDCTVLESELIDSVEGSDPFTVKLTFHCSVDGQKRSYEQSRGFSDVGDAQKLRDRFAPESRATGYVNPKKPEEAVLARASFAGSLVALFPLIFIGVGVGGLYFVWFYQGSQQGASFVSRRAASEGTIKEKLAMGCFFGVFFIAGSCILYFLTVSGLIQSMLARAWIETPCRIVSSRVGSGSEGDTFRVEVLYSYSYEGREYRSDDYDFSIGYTSGYDSKKAVVDRYAEGSDSVCYVNPAEPSEAVLSRSLSSTMWFGLLGLPFFLVGAGGLWFTFGPERKRPKRPGWENET